LLQAARVKPGEPLYRQMMWTGLIASVAPDFDLLYFYLIDHRLTLHHDYFSHTPYFWLCFFILGLFVAAMSGQRAMYFGAIVMFMNVMLHLLLDTVVGGIRWGWPLDLTNTVMFTVPNVHAWWVMNFILHWSFLIECGIFGLATYVFRHRRAQQRLHDIRKSGRAPIPALTRGRVQTADARQRKGSA